MCVVGKYSQEQSSVDEIGMERDDRSLIFTRRPRRRDGRREEAPIEHGERKVGLAEFRQRRHIVSDVLNYQLDAWLRGAVLERGDFRYMVLDDDLPGKIRNRIGKLVESIS